MAAGQARYDGQMENALIALQLNNSGTFEALYSGGLRTKPLGGVQVSSGNESAGAPTAFTHIWPNLSTTEGSLFGKRLGAQ